MGWFSNFMNNVNNLITKRNSRVTIKPADPVTLNINAVLDFEANAAKNRIWYRGEAAELEQLYMQLSQNSAMYNFWSSKSSPGMEMRKIHTGLPSTIIDVLATVVLADLNDIKITKAHDNEIWKTIAKENKLSKMLENSLKETLYIGDGAFKVTYDESVSEWPIIEYYPGDQIDFVINRSRIQEIIFKTRYYHNGQEFILEERYGYGYIKNRLTKDGRAVDLAAIPETQNLSDFIFAGYKEDKDGNMSAKGAYMMAVPIMIYKSSKYSDRGQSLFDKKIDAFDALDEAWSQWMDALRAGRTKEYIPENMLPRNPETGRVLMPNSFDNRYITTAEDMREGANSKIQLDQPEIPHESYLATYVTALDLCLQGIISPSTIGIDVKKLDNAEAQREKEKTTLYTRAAIVETLTEDLKELVKVAVNVYKEIHSQPLDMKLEADVTFGEYANPSFESQVETVAKGKSGNIMSIEACVEELYGDTRDENWKQEEIARLKAEQGIVVMEEPGLQTEKGEFSTNTQIGFIANE